ncbi:MAG TPA: hypothetical protein VGX94_19750 [Terriglobia bacterium]|nr:hypothetical protein [Terriglobia bacterium]
MGRVVHLETNSLAVLEQATRLLGDSNGSRPERRNFIWRIVAEAGTDGTEWPEMTAFSQDDLSFASIGQHGFLAVDAKQRKAVAFVAEELAKDALGFGRPFLAMLFTLSSPPMGLCPIWAACVAEGESGLLIFGPPRVGKTVSAYLAGGFGLHFHADRLVFLEAASTGLLAWGELWPACFYRDAHAVLPEFNAVARPFDCGGQTYLYLEKPRQANAPLCVRLGACVFLERQDMHGHRLTRLREDDFRRRLSEYRQFSDGRSPQIDRSDAWNLLCRLPAFHLAHGSDPRVPARLFRDLIEGHES